MRKCRNQKLILFSEERLMVSMGLSQMQISFLKPFLSWTEKQKTRKTRYETIPDSEPAGGLRVGGIGFRVSGLGFRV